MINTADIDFLQVERSPTLMRHLDNLIFEFLTSEAGYAQLLSYPSQSQMQLAPAASPKIPSPRCPRPAACASIGEGASTVGTESTSQKIRILGDNTHRSVVKSTQERVPLDQPALSITVEASKQVIFPQQRRKTALYAQVSIGPTPGAITRYEESIVNYVTKKYPSEVVLSDTIPLVSQSEREDIQRKYPDHISPFSTFYGNNSTHNTNTAVPIADFLSEELFGMPRLLSTILFTIVDRYSQQIGDMQTLAQALDVPVVDDLSKEHVLPLPATVPTSTLLQIYTEYCRGKRYEQRFYALFHDTVGPSKQHSWHPSARGEEERISMARIVHIALNILCSHPAYTFVEPFMYKRALATVSAARLFFDLDLEGCWYLTYTTAFWQMGVSILEHMWSLQSLENIAGDTGPFGYEAFYVIYCSFVRTADIDAQGRISEEGMQQYNNEMYSQKFVRRLLEGKGRPLYMSCNNDYEPSLSLIDFTIFMLAEYAIDTYASIRYFYNIADGDHDGLVSIDDLRVCLEEQAEEWSLYALDLTVDELLSQIVDIIHFVPDDFEDTETYGLSIVQHGFGAGNVSHFGGKGNEMSGCFFSFDQFFRCASPFNVFSALFSARRLLHVEQRDPYVGNLRGEVIAKRPTRIPHTASETWSSFFCTAYDQLLVDSE